MRNKCLLLMLLIIIITVIFIGCEKEKTLQFKEEAKVFISETLQEEYILIFSFIKAEVESKEKYIGLSDEMVDTVDAIIELTSDASDAYSSSDGDNAYAYTLYYDMMVIPTVHTRGYLAMNGMDYTDRSTEEVIDVNALIEEYNTRLNILLEDFFVEYLVYS